MDKISKAIELATKEFKKEYGQDAKLQEGDEFVTIFNDGVVTISMTIRYNSGFYTNDC